MLPSPELTAGRGLLNALLVLRDKKRDCLKKMYTQKVAVFSCRARHEQ